MVAPLVPDERHFVIVGGGQSGGSAAKMLRSAGFQGAITLISEEAYPPYERPPLSKDVLLGTEPYESTYLDSESWYSSNHVNLRLNTRVIRIDRGNKTVETDSGEAVRYDKLLLATGARVRTLHIPNAELEGIHYLRGIDDCIALADEFDSCTHLLAIGGGFISLEVAAVARTLGISVTVLEVAPSILARLLEGDVAKRIEGIHREKGVDFRTGVVVEHFLADSENHTSDCPARVQGVQLRNGEKILADLVLVGVGIHPNTELAETAGLEVEDGIRVNEYGETSDPAIYACGDNTNHYDPWSKTNRRLQSWQNAQDQAAAVANVMCGNRVPYEAVPWFWSDQYDMNLQMAGVSDGCDQSIVRIDDTGKTFSKVYLKNNQVIGAVSINAPHEVMAARKLIARKASLDVAKLADPDIDLRKTIIR